EALLCGKKQSIVIAGSTGIELIHKAEKLALLGVRQVCEPPLVRVCGRVTGRERRPSGTRYDYRGIELLASPKMIRFVAHSCHREKPVVSHLPLQAEVPGKNGDLFRVRLHRHER